MFYTFTSHSNFYLFLGNRKENSIQPGTIRKGVWYLKVGTFSLTNLHKPFFLLSTFQSRSENIDKKILQVWSNNVCLLQRNVSFKRYTIYYWKIMKKKTNVCILLKFLKGLSFCNVTTWMQPFVLYTNLYLHKTLWIYMLSTNLIF